jgi:hypothetical protein
LRKETFAQKQDTFHPLFLFFVFPAKCLIYQATVIQRYGREKYLLDYPLGAGIFF